ncbi:hypothetical protein, partial [Barnesiella intestinihominis]|uniref:hypothetical protein n=1 Tax=Barnesiella intestinihominis TaxID=487174 RepID=UPI003AB2F5AC
DDVQEDGTNFTPRIVRFAGLHPLPAGERWGYPSGLAGPSDTSPIFLHCKNTEEECRVHFFILSVISLLFFPCRFPWHYGQLRQWYRGDTAEMVVSAERG